MWTGRVCKVQPAKTLEAHTKHSAERMEARGLVSSENYRALGGRVPRLAPRDDQSSDSTLEPAQQLNCRLTHTAVEGEAKQINHVKSMRAMTKALTRKQNNTQKEIGCRLFLLARLPVKLDSSAVRHHPFYFSYVSFSFIQQPSTTTDYLHTSSYY